MTEIEKSTVELIMAKSSGIRSTEVKRALLGAWHGNLVSSASVSKADLCLALNLACIYINPEADAPGAGNVANSSNSEVTEGGPLTETESEKAGPNRANIVTKDSQDGTFVTKTSGEVSRRPSICGSLWKGKMCDKDDCDRTHLPLCNNTACQPSRLADCRNWHPKPVKMGNHQSDESDLPPFAYPDPEPK